VAAREGVVTTPEVGVSARAAGSLRELGAPRSFYRDAEAVVRRNLPSRELATIIATGSGTLWVDIDTTNPHQFALLEKVFNFHPLAIEDTLNPSTRVKLEEYDGFLFMVIRGVKFVDQTDDPYDLETFNLNFFLGKNYLVTVHTETSPSLDAVADRLERTPDPLARGPALLMHAIMDMSVDAYFPILDQIDEFVDGLEERVFVDFDESALRDIFSVKRLVLSLRRHLSPQREVFNVLTNRPSALLSHETQLYFRDVYDHVLRINEALETYRELLSSTLDSYLTQVSNRLGRVTKGLSVVATVSIPFVVVSGMWGMNFVEIPLAESVYGFWLMLVLQLAIGGGLLALLHKRKLL
jgi:magnesium transporter